MLNFLVLTALAVFVFRVPLKGSFLTLAAAALLYVIAATAMGLVISSFMRSQTAALFATAILTILPASQFSGMIDPVSSLEGVGALIGAVYPTTHFLTIARGTFSKGLDFADLHASFVPLADRRARAHRPGGGAAPEAGALSMANILHLGVKELRSLLRDPMMLVLIAYSFTGVGVRGDHRDAGDPQQGARSASSTRIDRRSPRASSMPSIRRTSCRPC